MVNPLTDKTAALVLIYFKKCRRLSKCDIFSPYGHMIEFKMEWIIKCNGKDNKNQENSIKLPNHKFKNFIEK